MSDDKKNEELGNSVLPDDFTVDLKNAVDESMKLEEEPKKLGDEFEKPSKDQTETVDGEGEKEEDTEELPPDEGDEPKSKEDDSPGAEDEDEDDPDGDDDIDDNLLEQAVKAGMSMKNARKFPDAESLREALSLLPGGSKQDESGSEGESKSAIDEALENIPDLDPEEYDEAIVSQSKALKDLIRQQAMQIEALTKSKTGTWMEEQINTLGDVAKIVREDPGKRNSLQKKFDVLKAGYAANGEKVSDELIFQEAASMALSSELSEAKSKAKAESAKKRSSQRINRPTSKSVKPAVTVEQEAANALKEKFNIQ